MPSPPSPREGGPAERPSGAALRSPWRHPGDFPWLEPASEEEAYRHARPPGGGFAAAAAGQVKLGESKVSSAAAMFVGRAISENLSAPDGAPGTGGARMRPSPFVNSSQASSPSPEQPAVATGKKASTRRPALERSYTLANILDAEARTTTATRCLLSRYFELFRAFLLGHTESLKVQVFVFVVVMFDTVVVIVSSRHDTPGVGLHMVELIVLVILCLDILARIVARGCSFFTGKGRALNIFEVFVVLLCITAEVMQRDAMRSIAPWLRTVGRVAKFMRPMILGCQRTNVAIHAAHETARQKVFDVLSEILGDCVRVRPEDVTLDPLLGVFAIEQAEVRLETFEDLHLPLCILGGAVRHLRVQVPLQGFDASKNIQVQLSGVELVLGPERGDWSHEALRRRKGRLVDLLNKRTQLLGPLIMPRKQKSKDDNKKTVTDKLAALQRVPSRLTTVTAKEGRMGNMKANLMNQILHKLFHALSVDIYNVVARFEADRDEISAHAFSCGFSLRSCTFSATVANVQAGTSSYAFGLSRTGGVSQMLWRARSWAASTQSPMEGGTGSASLPTSSCSTRGPDASDQPNEQPDGLAQKLRIERLSFFWDRLEDSAMLKRHSYKAIDHFYQNDMPGEALKLARLAHRKVAATRARESMKLRAVDHLVSKFAEHPQKRHLLKGPMFRERFDAHYYVLFPTSATMVVEWRNGDETTQKSLRMLSLAVDPICLSVDDCQMESFNRLFLHFRNWWIESQISITRPAGALLVPVDQQRSYVHVHDPLADDPLAETGDLQVSPAQRWWRHAMRSCQVRLNLKPKTIGTKWAWMVAEEVQAEYVDLAMQSSFRDKLKESSITEIQGRMLDLQVPLAPIVCLRLLQIAREEVKRLRKAALGAESKKDTTSLSFGAKLSVALEDDEDEEEDMDDVFKVLVAEERVERSRIPTTSLPSFASTASMFSSGSSDSMRMKSSSSSLLAAGRSSSRLELGQLDQPPPPSTEFILSLRSVEVNILVHSIWSTVLRHHWVRKDPPADDASPRASAVVTSSRPASPRRFSWKGRSSSKVNLEEQGVGAVGGFGFEKFGPPLMPRNQLICIGISKVSGKISLPWALFERGAVLGSCASMNIERIYATSPMAPPAFRALLQFDPRPGAEEHGCCEFEVKAKPPMKSVDHMKMKSGQLDGEDEFSDPAAIPSPPMPTVADILWKARWHGEFRIAPIRANFFEPTVQRLIAMMAKGKVKTQAQQEFDHNVYTKHRENKFQNLTQAFARFHGFFPVSVDLKGDIGAINAQLLACYCESFVLSVTVTLPSIAPMVKISGSPPSVSMSVAGGRAEDASGEKRGIIPSVGRSLDWPNQEEVIMRLTDLGPRHDEDAAAETAHELPVFLSNLSSVWSYCHCPAEHAQSLDPSQLTAGELIPDEIVDPSSLTFLPNLRLITKAGESKLPSGYIAPPSSRSFPSAISSPVLSTVTALKQLPWSVKIETFKSTQFGLWRGDLAHRVEDLRFLDPDSLITWWKRHMGTNDTDTAGARRQHSK